PRVRACVTGGVTNRSERDAQDTTGRDPIVEPLSGGAATRDSRSSAPVISSARTAANANPDRGSHCTAHRSKGTLLEVVELSRLQSDGPSPQLVRTRRRWWYEHHDDKQQPPSGGQHHEGSAAMICST